MSEDSEDFEDMATVRQHSALIKGLRVLEVVATQHRISDIARMTGLSLSTVHRILADLVAHGWVRQDHDHLYYAGDRPHGLASLIGGEDDYRRSVVPHLLALREETGYTVHFAVRRGDQLTYTVKLDGAGAYRMRSHVGMELPVHSTAIGKAVLTTMDLSEVDCVLARARIRRLTARTLVNRSQILDQLEVTGRRGWALDNGENEIHTRCIGVAVPGRKSGEAIGGLSLSGLDHELDDARIETLAPYVVATGRAVSEELAGT